jgi:uncharacterized protein YecE (DUF72 family)
MTRPLPGPAGYALGCPFWSFGGWNGGLYTRDARPGDRLTQYARVFNTVEGNTTFWSVPSARSVERWREAVPPGFRFCFKVPREITHERMLLGADGELFRFLEALEPLRENLGPFLVQLPPAFGPRRLRDLEAFLDGLPETLHWAVELRHRAFYDDPVAAGEADDLLLELGCDRAIMDTRALRAGNPRHPEVLAALHKKPDLPLRPEPVGRRPMVRFVGHPEAAPNDATLDEWAERLAGWIAGGLEPYFFVHTASNLHTPQVARDLHRRIARRLDVGRLPDFPGESGEQADGQLPLIV